MLHPISFSIPREKIVTAIPTKTKLLSSLIPGDVSTYLYNTETEYYDEYKKSLFALTHKKGGWDCLRHYEIIACGTIPYFPDIDKCPPNTLTTLPKDLLLEGNALYLSFIGKKYDRLSHPEKIKAFALITKLLQYARAHLTTERMAATVLDKTELHPKTILYISEDIKPDYLRCLTLHGMKQCMDVDCHDYPKIPHLYKSNQDHTKLYGRGYSYTNLLSDTDHKDDWDATIEDDLRHRRYDLVIYASYHRGKKPLWDVVQSVYEPNRIVFLCGEDIHLCDSHTLVQKGYTVFVREI